MVLNYLEITVIQLLLTPVARIAIFNFTNKLSYGTSSLLEHITLQCHIVATWNLLLTPMTNRVPNTILKFYFSCKYFFLLLFYCFCQFILYLQFLTVITDNYSHSSRLNHLKLPWNFLFHFTSASYNRIFEDVHDTPIKKM